MRTLLLQSSSPAPLVRLTLFVTLCASLRGQSESSFGDGDTLKPLRPASVAASPLCMKHQQAGVITPVPSTVRSGTSMVRNGQEAHQKSSLWHHNSSRSYYYEWLNWWHWGRVGYGAENEYMNNVGTNRANTGKQVLSLFFLFSFLILRDEM